MCYFWATIEKIGLLYISTSCHTSNYLLSSQRWQMIWSCHGWLWKDNTKRRKKTFEEISLAKQIWGSNQNVLPNANNKQQKCCNRFANLIKLWWIREYSLTLLEEVGFTDLFDWFGFSWFAFVKLSTDLVNSQPLKHEASHDTIILLCTNLLKSLYNCTVR